MIFYFIMCARYLGFKQQFLYAKLLNLSSDLKVLLQKRHQQQLLSVKGGALWRDFTSFNNELDGLTHEVEAYNRFWSKYLALYFVAYIIHTTYMPFSFIFERTQMGFFGRKFFLIFGTQIAGVLLWVNYECSAIVSKNTAIYRERRRFVSIFAQRYAKLGVGDYLKV